MPKACSRTHVQHVLEPAAHAVCERSITFNRLILSSANPHNLGFVNLINFNCGIQELWQKNCISTFLVFFLKCLLGSDEEQEDVFKECLRGDKVNISLQEKQITENDRVKSVNSQRSFWLSSQSTKIGVFEVSKEVYDNKNNTNL